MLSPAYPNPFTRQTTITLTLPAAQPASLAVFNILGQQVGSLHQGMLLAGVHRFVFEAAGLPSGVYVIRASGASFSKAEVVLLTR